MWDDEKGTLVEDVRFLYQHVWVKFDIELGDSVLDVGSGHLPFPLATCLLDRFVESGEQRPDGVALKRDARPLVAADVAFLPFRDKSFDFIYCSNVLEHVDDPVMACEELMRVGHRGYIECPSPTDEVLLGSNKHLWFVFNDREVLSFLPRTIPFRSDVQGLFYGLRHIEQCEKWYWTHMPYFRTMFLWRERFQYRVWRVEVQTEKCFDLRFLA